MGPRSLTQRAWLSLLVALTAGLLASCGGSNGSSSASSQKAFSAADVNKFPECMRAHGVSSFPDARVNGTHITIQLTPSIVGSPAFKSARQACAYLLPAKAGQLGGLSVAQRRARAAGLLSFAGCVRNHGFPNFPDPNSQGQLTVQMITQAGINLGQPAVRQAGDACVSASHGQISRADVALAIAEASGSQSSPGG